MMPRLVAVLSGLLCATNALRPQTRHQFFKRKTSSTPSPRLKAGAALLPAAATASTRDYTPADEDMKGLLSSFTTELDDKEAAAAQKKIDDAKPSKRKSKPSSTPRRRRPRSPPRSPGPAPRRRASRKGRTAHGRRRRRHGYSTLGY